MEEILSRHRKESRDLQSRITQKKKGASKKTRKGVNDECTSMEEELKTKHEVELQAASGHSTAEEFKNDSPSEENSLQSDLPAQEVAQMASSDCDLRARVQQMKLLDGDVDNHLTLQNETQQQPRKRNRQKDRLARRAAEQDAVAAEAADEAASLPDLRKKERERMVEEFERRRLEEKAVAANGHCMFSAVADQLHTLGINLEPDRTLGVHPELQKDDYKTVRNAAAMYISRNPDDFEPFLEEPLHDYVSKIRDTAEWGGQLELLALARTYSITINVLQSEGRIEQISCNHSTKDDPQAWLAYYRHGFGLGEHYNSLRRADPESQQQDAVKDQT